MNKSLGGHQERKDEQWGFIPGEPDFDATNWTGKYKPGDKFAHLSNQFNQSCIRVMNNFITLYIDFLLNISD